MLAAINHQDNEGSGPTFVGMKAESGLFLPFSAFLRRRLFC
jgi:hypothetical protein